MRCSRSPIIPTRKPCWQRFPCRIPGRGATRTCRKARFPAQSIHPGGAISTLAARTPWPGAVRPGLPCGRSPQGDSPPAFSTEQGEQRMTKRRLGRTDMDVTPIGLGCWQFSQGANFAGRVWDSLPDESIRSVVEASVKGGVNWFDTAEAYGNGRSEQKLSEALAALDVKPGTVVVATKWQPFF